MPRRGYENTPIIIFDGEDKVDNERDSILSSLNAEHGAGNFDYYNVAVSGQNLDDMQSRLVTNVMPFLSRTREVIYMIEPGLNELDRTTTAVQAVNKVKAISDTLKGVLPRLKFKVGYANYDISPLNVTLIAKELAFRTALIGDRSGKFDRVVNLDSGTVFEDILDVVVKEEIKGDVKKRNLI